METLFALLYLLFGGLMLQLHPGMLGLLFLDFVVGFIVSAYSRDYSWPLFTMLIFPFALIFIFLGLQNELPGAWLALIIYCMPSGLVACGLGVLLGYGARKHKRPTFLFRPRTPQQSAPRLKELRCVACEKPIECGCRLCPECGYTQPG